MAPKLVFKWLEKPCAPISTNYTCNGRSGLLGKATKKFHLDYSRDYGSLKVNLLEIRLKLGEKKRFNE